MFLSLPVPVPLLFDAIRSGDDGGPDKSWTSADASAREEPAPSDADRLLVERVRAGDEDAFLETYRAYYQRLCDFANGYVRDPAAAEDLVADLFLRIWRARAEWRVSGSVRSYLFSAVRYRALNVQRDLHRRAGLEAAAMARGEVPGMSESPVTTEIATEIAADTPPWGRIWTAVAELPERSRLVITLRWKEEMPIPDIARVLGSSEMAVRQLHKRALAILRTKLAGLIE